MKAICDETVKTQRIFGWQGSDDIKFHIMSVRQFVQIKRFKLPNNNLFNPFDDQILIIMQYP